MLHCSLLILMVFVWPRFSHQIMNAYFPFNNCFIFCWFVSFITLHRLKYIKLQKIAITYFWQRRVATVIFTMMWLEHNIGHCHEDEITHMPQKEYFIHKKLLQESSSLSTMKLWWQSYIQNLVNFFIWHLQTLKRD